jgi:hypothetical protein
LILSCADCQQTYPLNTRHWHCQCGGVFELKDGFTGSWPNGGSMQSLHRLHLWLP